MCDNTFPSLVASLFSWRCLAASTSYFLHAAMNLRPPSVTVSTHTSAFNFVAFQSPAMPNARMSLCTQSIHSFSFPPRPLRTAPSRFPNTIRLGSRPPPAAHSEERPRPQKSSRSQRRLNSLTPGYLKGTVVRSHPMVWSSLALCPDYTKPDSVVYGAEFGVVFLAKSPRTASMQEASVASTLTIRVLEESTASG